MNKEIDYSDHLPDGAEVRSRPFGEFRADETDGAVTIEGHAATFSEPYDVGPFREQIAPGAFKDSIESDDVRALFNHDPNHPLGRQSSGTLKLEEDEVGLRSEIDLPASADTVAEAIERGDVQEMSFGFEVLEESFDREDGKELRTIEKARLYDVSPVVFPANPNTDVALRSLEEWRSEQGEAEMRDKDEGPTETITVRFDADVSALREKLEEMEALAERVQAKLPENRQSRPDFDGTEDISPEWADDGWAAPNLSDHPEVGDDDEWDDLDAEARAAVAGRAIEGTADADTYGELGYWVVNPATDRLNRNGVLAARQRASAEDDTEVASIADALWEEHFKGDEEGNTLDVGTAERLTKLEEAKGV